MTMNPVPATQVPQRDTTFGLRESAVSGAYTFSEDNRELFYICPCGCGEHLSLPVKIGPWVQGASPCWGWDGNRDAPTLTPSIRRLNGCRYHGHLQAGVWTFTSDSGRR
jgi:hypothetical protein